tara:strand:- start:48615 stop:49124 length:510 start_codon:yes stop_codon:yes gene_type:complete
MKPLIVMGLRTLAHLEAKATLYEEINQNTITARRRFPKEDMELLVGAGFTLGILSSHSIPRSQKVIEYLDLAHLFPERHLICSSPLDRKEALNWQEWSQTFNKRGLSIHTVIDIGDTLIRNLASSPNFKDIDKYLITDDTTIKIEGAKCLKTLDQIKAYDLAKKKGHNN